MIKPRILAESVLMTAREKLIQEIQQAPDSLVEEVLQVFLLLKEKQLPPRVPGMDEGKIWIAPDFDDPLPDDILNDFLNPSDP
jgi:hypothetical protein